MNSRRLARFERRLLGGMKHREHIDSIGEDAVDDSVRCFDHLADVLAIELRNPAARLRKSCDLLRPARQTGDDAKGVSRGIQRDVVMDPGELLLRVIGPANFQSSSP